MSPVSSLNKPHDLQANLKYEPIYNASHHLTAYLLPSTGMRFSIRILSVLYALAFSVVVTTQAYAESQLNDKPLSTTGTVALDLSIATMAISAWGISQWDWFQHSPVMKEEGWFGEDTHAGGADKTGHFYMSYMLSELFIWDFKRNGVKNPAPKAALAAMTAMTLVEIGDATSSKYGFSHEDLIADGLGVAASWLLASSPTWNDRINIRMEYWPSNGYNLKNDAVSDYSGMKHLVALRGDGFESLNNTPLRWLELQAGYYTRGFRSFDEQSSSSRHAYVGIGLSLPALAGKDSKLGTVLKYIQPPGFYLEHDKEF